MDRFAAFACVIFMLAGCAPTPARADPAPLSQWAAVVVAGDDHASHTSNLTQTFDNARRDVSAALEARGFSSANLREFSLRPELYPDEKAAKAEPQAIHDSLRELASHAPGGCLIYFSSHGNRSGLVVGDTLIPPNVMAGMIEDACGARPTVVIISACFSGIFVPALKAQDRMILTAARRDRSSFGCGESDRYPFFDDCLLRAMPAAADFPALGPLVSACVAAREAQVGAKPASQPQLWVGKDFLAPPFARPTG